ncbi:MAG: ComEA family DNA-binding protein [Clostridiaceae bacterium]
MKITTEKKSYELVNSLWIILNLFFGFTSFISFLYIGYRAKSKKWTICGVLYSIPVIIYIFMGKIYKGNEKVAIYLTIIMFLTSTISIIHGLLVRKEYLIRIETIKLKNNEYKGEIKKLNINSADIKHLIKIPLISRKKAEKVLKYRDDNGDIKNLNEIQKLLKLKTYEVERLKYLVEL